MAKILYRQSLTPATPSAVTAGSAVKGTPLTMDEGDYNYKALNDDIQTRASLSGANFTGPVTLSTALAISSGGTGATTAAGARTNFGATTVGSNLFTVANPSAITFIRINADNTISTLDATTFRSAISAGTVTSVGGTGTVSGLTLSGSVSTTGNLTLGGSLSVTPSNFASQSANTVLAAPNGSSGTPTFRALVPADIPTLNQNTTGTASNVTGTVAIANGGTGATTAAGALTAFNRASYLREQNGATFVPGSIYSIYSNGPAITMYLPTFANAVVGDTIRCVELNRGGWATTNWTVAIPANTYLNNLMENMTIDTSIGAFSITCTFKDATNAYWTLSVG